MAVEVWAMRMVKSVVSIIGTVAAILYCGWLLSYFYDVSGSLEEAQRDGLMPTLLGLGTVGLIFCVVLIVKIARMFAGPRSPGSGGRGGAMVDGESGFDADAVVARYMARRAAEPSPVSPAAPPAQKRSAPDKPRSFGRKGR
jgi:hypothetical protein